MSPNAADPIHPTKASNMFAFGVMAFEVRKIYLHGMVSTHSRQVLTGSPLFSEMTEIAATYSILSGIRPLRLNHHEIPDPLWRMMEGCWQSEPSKRMSVGETLNILEMELRRVYSDPHEISHV